MKDEGKRLRRQLWETMATPVLCSGACARWRKRPPQLAMYLYHVWCMHTRAWRMVASFSIIFGLFCEMKSLLEPGAHQSVFSWASWPGGPHEWTFCFYPLLSALGNEVSISIFFNLDSEIRTQTLHHIWDASKKDAEPCPHPSTQVLLTAPREPL